MGHLCVWWEEWEGGLRSLTHTRHYTHTHTHTERRVYDVELWKQLYTFFTQSNGLFPSSMSIIMACNVFTLWNASHTHTKVVGAHTHTDTNFFFFFEGASLPFSHTWFSLESDNSLAKKWHDQDEKERLDENPVNFTNKPWCLWEFWSAAAHAEETETPSSYT
jgi:hypothetical protein